MYGKSAPDHGLGAFFTDNLTMAKWFAGMVDYDVNVERYVDLGNEKSRVVSARLDIKNPWVLNDHYEVDEDDPGQTYFDAVDDYGGGEAMREKLSKMGYDSVVVNGMNTNYYEDGNYNIYAVFDPRNISIIDNNVK